MAADISSAKEHFDVVSTLLSLSAAGLFGACLYIIRQHNQSDSKTITAVEKMHEEVTVLKEQSKQSDKTSEVVDQHTKQIARLYTGVGKIMAAHNINHQGQNLEL